MTYALNVLVVSTCYTGHLTPTLTIVRKLLSRGHTVDFLTANICCENKIQKSLSKEIVCWDREIITIVGVDTNNPVEAIMQVRTVAAENGTGMAFEEVRDFLSKSPKKYDVIMADWAVLGATIAAQLHKIPVVTNYVGTIFFALEEDGSNRLKLAYVPEPYSFLSDFVEFITGYLYQKAASAPAYDIIVDINKKFNMEPQIENYGLTFLLPSTYYHAFSNLIHIGPPDVFTSNINFMNKKTNVHHVGYLPEPEFSRKLDNKVYNFVKNSKVPVVYISMGTVIQIDISKLAKVIEGLSNQNEYAFIWSASDVYFDKLKSIGLPEDNLIVVNNVAQFTLLMNEDVAAFVTHAGWAEIQTFHSVFSKSFGLYNFFRSLFSFDQKVSHFFPKKRNCTTIFN